MPDPSSASEPLGAGPGAGWGVDWDDPRLTARMTVSLYDDDVAHAALCALEAAVDARGWDQPWTLWAVRPGAAVPAGPFDGLDDEDELFVCDPVPVDGRVALPDALTGLRLDDDALAAVLSYEAWSVTGTGGALDRLVDPRTHPGRFEVRVLVAVLADGRALAVTRRRGGDPGAAVPGTSRLSGSLVAHLRRCLDLPVATPRHSPRLLAARAWVSGVADALVAMPPAHDADALAVAVALDPLLELLGLLDPADLPGDLAERAASAAAAPSALDAALTTDPDALAALDGFAAAPQEVDPVAALLGPGPAAALDAMLDDWERFHALAAAGDLDGVDPDVAAWMGPSLFATRIVDALPPTCDTLATVEAIAPVVARYLAAVCAVRHWPLDDALGGGFTAGPVVEPGP